MIWPVARISLVVGHQVVPGHNFFLLDTPFPSQSLRLKRWSGGTHKFLKFYIDCSFKNWFLVNTATIIESKARC